MVLLPSEIPLSPNTKSPHILPSRHPDENSLLLVSNHLYSIARRIFWKTPPTTRYAAPPVPAPVLNSRT